MNAGYIYSSIVAIVILNINIVSTLKRVRNEQETAINTLVGIICSITIFVSIVAICER